MVFKRRTFDFLLHLDAQEGSYKFARWLRKRSTKAEIKLWDELKGRKLSGLKFRRQHPIHIYIADFYCHEQRLVIEVDGMIHLRKENKDHDMNRDAELSRLGIRTLRFSNEEIFSDINQVREQILKFLQTHPIR